MEENSVLSCRVEYIEEILRKVEGGEVDVVID